MNSEKNIKNFDDFLKKKTSFSPKNEKIELKSKKIEKIENSKNQLSNLNISISGQNFDIKSTENTEKAKRRLIFENENSTFKSEKKDFCSNITLSHHNNKNFFYRRSIGFSSGNEKNENFGDKGKLENYVSKKPKSFVFN